MTGYFFPDDRSAVLDAARGLALAHPDLLAVCPDPLYVIARSPDPRRTVALVSGGGAGHEPLHAGFVGAGGLDAACPGEVFTSPHNRAVYEASRACARGGGVLHIVKNYTGDVINFAIAAERLRADGLDVATVLVDDDLATESAGDGPGRRGTGAAVLVEKVLGAAADDGASLSELADLGARVAAASRSIAIASRAQTSLATGAPAFDLTGGELEYGVGIHGERAATTLPATPTSEVLARMVSELTAAVRVGPAGVALLVNGLGATTGLELHAVRAAVGDALASAGTTVATSLVGTYTAALDMRGFSVTLLALEEGWLELLTRPTRAPSLPALAAAVPESGVLLEAVERSAGAASTEEAGGSDATGAEVLRRFTAAIDEVRGALTALDQRAGDGDFGDNLAGGLARSASRQDGLAGAGAVFLDEVGGSSGPLFGLVFSALAEGLRGQGSGLAGALAGALAAVQRVGGAQVGDRTLIDALAPAASAAAGSGGDGSPVVRAATAAVEGARASADLLGRRGRSSYVGDRALGAPDPGAVAVAILLVVVAGVLDPDAAASLPSAGELAGQSR